MAPGRIVGSLVGLGERGDLVVGGDLVRVGVARVVMSDVDCRGKCSAVVLHRGRIGEDVVELREESILRGLGVQMLSIRRIDEHNH